MLSRSRFSDPCAPSIFQVMNSARRSGTNRGVTVTVPSTFFSSWSVENVREKARK